MDLSIVMPTVGERNVLDRTLDALFSAIQGLSVEVILVDDSMSGDLKVDRPDLHLLHTHGRGASNARNAGWRMAAASLVLFIDDDILIDRGHIERTISLHAETSDKAYNFAWIYPESLMEQLPKTRIGRYFIKEGLFSIEHRLGRPLEDLPSMMRETGLTSQYFSIERKWLEKVGGYDDIPFAGIEDSLLFKKLDENGVEVYLSTLDVVRQNESNRVRLSALCARYRRGALTRRIAVLRGHEDLGVQFSAGQIWKGRLGRVMRPLLKIITDYFPYGWVYRKAVRSQLFLATYDGYYVEDLPAEYAAEFDQFRRQET